MQKPPALRAIVGVDFIALTASLFPVVSLVLAGPLPSGPPASEHSCNS